MRTARFTGVMLSLFAAVVVTTPARGQRPTPSADSSVLRGRVVDAGRPVAGAEIALPGLGVATRSDADGRFQLDLLPAGEHVVELRHPGREQTRETVTLRAHQETVVTLVLGHAVTLDTVRSSAAQTPWYLRDFESRRARGGAGRFLTDSMLRANEQVTMTSLLRSHVPGLRIINYRGFDFPAAGRTTTDGFAINPQDARSPKACIPQIYVDGQLMWEGPPAIPPPLSTFAVFNYAAIEYYAGSASTPLEFRSLRNPCGVLILWRRQR